LPDDATVGDLIADITSKTSIAKFDVKYGYPPKPLRLDQSQRSTPLKELDVTLDGEQLTISAKDEPVEPPTSKPAALSKQQTDSLTGAQQEGPEASFSFGGLSSTPSKQKSKPIALKKQSMAGDVPEIPLPERGATLGKISNSAERSKVLTCTYKFFE
jgi:ubiquitin thioesterase OTU1